MPTIIPMRRIFIAPLLACGLALIAGPAAAQYQYRPYPVGDPATGEKYHVEFSAGYWFPAPQLLLTSEQLGIVGTTIDGVEDLGFVKSRFNQYSLVLRPATKHKFFFHYVPVRYEADTVLKREIIFNGIKFVVGLPIQASLDWKAVKIGYEYDFVYRDRGFAGFLLGAEYSDIRAELNSPIDHEWAQVRAPVPFIGGVARVYVFANVSVTGRVTGFQLPESVDKQRRYALTVLDTDIYGTLNFTDNFGVQGGYRAFKVLYKVKLDTGDFRENGLYLNAVVRY